jgi:DHA1 family bicyclomycin/chloramphenicol resistance-like MFS transporter
MSARPHAPLWLLVLVTFSGTLAMHMFVPALTTAAHELGTTPAAVQMTISLYVLGLAFGQLAYGPLSDKYGRRPTLLTGLTLYTAAGVVCMLATSVQVLVAARFAQALGGCAGLLLARAIVRDTANADDTLRRLAMMSLMTMVGPGLAPLLGALVVTSFGWRYIFVFSVALGVIGLALTWRLLPETRHADATEGPRSTLSADYMTLLRSPAFVGCVIGGGCATTGFYAFVAAAPFIFVEELHQPLEAVGVYLCLLIVGMSTGNVIASRLVRRVSLNRLMVGANAISVACALFLLAATLMFGLNTICLVVTMFVYCVGAGMCSPAVSTKAMSVNPKVTGSAAGLYGFAQMAIGAACTSLAGIGHDHGVTAIAVLVGAGVVGQVAFWVAVKDMNRRAPLPAAQGSAASELVQLERGCKG